MKETATPNNVEIHCEKSIQMPVKNTLFEISAKIIVQKSLAKTVKKTIPRDIMNMLLYNIADEAAAENS